MEKFRYRHSRVDVPTKVKVLVFVPQQCVDERGNVLRNLRVGARLDFSAVPQDVVVALVRAVGKLVGQEPRQVAHSLVLGLHAMMHRNQPRFLVKLRHLNKWSVKHHV